MRNSDRGDIFKNSLERTSISVPQEAKLVLNEEITDHQFPVSFHGKNHGFCLMKRNGTERISIASIFDIEESSIFGNYVGDILNCELDI